MSGTESYLLFSGILFYMVSFFLLWMRREKISMACLAAGIFLHAASSGVRWYGIGHPPVFGTYEAALAGSWFMLLYTAFSYRSIHGHFRPLLLTTVPVAILIILYGLSFNTEWIPLTITEKSLWVDFHAMFSWLAFGSYAAAACLGGVYLWKSGVDETSREVLDDLIFQYTNLGFVNHSVMFALGSYYSSILYGAWWQWDPVNSTSLITWLAYGLAIHMRLFYGWKGRRGANLAIVAFLTAIVSYWGLIYFPPGSTYHVFDIDLKSH